ncbi:multicopper oxidase-domain-containing protein [Phyllosticta citricarpa]|uniref:Multicopper oxidase-domain-containing protein n=2 Tax=Phyllosticta TaxID=121621 RepID=A0ABR1LH83_9PEZI
MGFFNTCWDLLLHLPFFEPLGGLDHGHGGQQPLSLHDDLTWHPHDASNGFTCTYPDMKGYKNCNGPDDRSCWLKDTSSRQPLFSQYDIHTDYENNWPQGVTREYWIEVGEQILVNDGYSKPHGKVINGTYPGPMIEACWGDEIVVHVKNWVATNGTTIHWHGIRMLGSNEMDGVNGVTQCPIAYGEEFTYKFKATQYGNSWYHSHYSSQYSDGVAGPLRIHGPDSANWDKEWKPLIMTDWFHKSSFELFTQEMTSTEPQTNANSTSPPKGDSILLDGHGHYDCKLSNDTKMCAPGWESYYENTFEPGKRYLINLINGGTSAAFIFSIDEHKMKVIAADFVPIEPYETNAVLLNPGQRYSVVIEANAKPGNYWIRTNIPKPSNAGGENEFGCGNVTDRHNGLTGIVRYDARSTELPTSTANEFPNNCHDEPWELLHPIYKWQVDQHPQNDVLVNTYTIGIETEERSHNAFRWELTNIPLWLDFDNPTILNVENKTWNPEYNIVDYNFNSGFVYLIISADVDRLVGADKREVPAGHPIHLHGHDFAILAQSSEPYNPNQDPLTKFALANPPRRDTVFVPSNGYVALAFKPDNPGAWAVHCHLNFHASSGLAMQILERQGEILTTNGNLEETYETCAGWKKYDAAHPVHQEDSGI